MQNTTRKDQIDKNTIKLNTYNNNKKYNIETICKSDVYKKNQKIYQNYIIWFYKKVIYKKKISKN